MSPRKSSTSSGRRPARPRYLGLELAGASSTLSPRGLATVLQDRLRAASGRPDAPARVVRLEGARALVEVPNGLVAAARSAWNGPAPLPGGRPAVISTRLTWGTLRKGKAWLRGPRPPGRDRGGSPTGPEGPPADREPSS